MNDYIDRALADGIIGAAEARYWTQILQGDIPAVSTDIMALFDRIHELLENKG